MDHHGGSGPRDHGPSTFIFQWKNNYKISGKYHIYRKAPEFKINSDLALSFFTQAHDL
jgi:hypothetical protein